MLSWWVYSLPVTIDNGRGIVTEYDSFIPSFVQQVAIVRFNGSASTITVHTSQQNTNEMSSRMVTPCHWTLEYNTALKSQISSQQVDTRHCQVSQQPQFEVNTVPQELGLQHIEQCLIFTIDLIMRMQNSVSTFTLGAEYVLLWDATGNKDGSESMQSISASQWTILFISSTDAPTKMLCLTTHKIWDARKMWI